MLEDVSAKDEIAARRRAMGLLARALASELKAPLARRWADHGARDLKPAETGLVMLRGRAGGDGAPFNLGEATVTRAIVELPGGERGYGHILGRDAERARLAAILDALWQRAETRIARLVGTGDSAASTQQPATNTSTNRPANIANSRCFRPTVRCR